MAAKKKFVLATTLEGLLAQRAGPDNAANHAAISSAIAAARKTQAAAPTPAAAPAPADTPAAAANPVTSTINPVAPGLNPQDNDVLTRLKGILGVGEQFGRGIADEFYKNGSLGRVGETLTPEEQASLDQAKQLSLHAGEQSQETRDLISGQKTILSNAQNLSPEEQEALGVARGNLQGLDAPEMQALREQSHQEINRIAQGQARELAKVQARNQVFGTSAAAQSRLLGQDTVHAGRDLERDLLVKNIDVKQAASNAFTNLVTNTQNSKDTRTNAASNTLANTELTDEGQRKNAQNAATAQQGTLSTSLGDRLRALQQFNLNQAAAEKAGQVGSIFGGIGTITDQRGLLAGEDFTNKQYSDSQAVQDKILQLIKESLSQQKATL